MQILHKQLIILLFLSMTLFSSLQAAPKTHFTIAIDPEYIPFTQRDIDGEATGLLVDFWNLWAKENGYVVEYKFYPWEETLLATQRGEVNFHSGTTKDRAWMYASKAIYELATSLFTLKTYAVQSRQDLVGKRIGTIDAYYGDLVKEVLGKDIEIVLYDDYPPMVEALKSGELDALVDDVEAIRYFLIKTGEMNKIKRVELKALQFVNKIYAITNQANSRLLPQINQGLSALNLIDLVNIEEVWLPRIDNAYYNNMFSEKIQYTPKEKVWIEAQKELSITGDPSWKRYDNNKYRGISGDYIDKFSQSIEKNFVSKSIDSWAELLVRPYSESADIVLGMMNDKIKKLLEEQYTFLKPYAIAPLVIIMDKDIRFVTDLRDIKDTHVGMLQLQNYTKAIEYYYSSYTFYYYATIEKLMKALSAKEIDAVILPLSDAMVTLSDSRYGAFDIIGKMDNEAYMSIGILKGKPELAYIMEKLIQSLSRYEKKKILTKWTRKLNYIEKVDYFWTYMITGFLSLLLLGVLYYVYILHIRNKKAKAHSSQLEVLVEKDDLTGLLNKRAFNKNFEEYHHGKSSLGLLFIDVDCFKEYNDFYGHLSGDNALKKIATILKSFHSNKVDVYRVGGEEFAAILYGFNEKAAKALAQEICDAIAHKGIEHANSKLGMITVSIGVSLGTSQSDRHNLYITSDRALYKAKTLGKNQIYFQHCKG